MVILSESSWQAALHGRKIKAKFCSSRSPQTESIRCRICSAASPVRSSICLSAVQTVPLAQTETFSNEVYSRSLFLRPALIFFGSILSTIFPLRLSISFALNTREPLTDQDGPQVSSSPKGSDSQTSSSDSKHELEIQEAINNPTDQHPGMASMLRPGTNTGGHVTSKST